MAVAGRKYFAAQKKAELAQHAAEAKAREIAHKFVEAKLDRQDALEAALAMTLAERVTALETSLAEVLGMSEDYVKQEERSRAARSRDGRKAVYQARKSIERAQILLDAKRAVCCEDDPPGKN